MTPVINITAVDVLVLLATAYFVYVLVTRRATTASVPARRGHIRVARLLCYPIKACRGVDLLEAKIGEAGIEYDRRWLILDPNTHRGITAERTAKTVLIRPTLNLADGTLDVSLPSGSFSVPLHLSPADLSACPTILPYKSDGAPFAEDGYLAYIVSPAANAALSAFLGRESVLVMMAGSRREAQTRPGEKLGWHDQHQLLITSVESCADVFARTRATAAKPASERPGGFDAAVWARGEDLRVFMERFRPNVVLEGLGAPFEEDKLLEVSIGDVVVDVIQRCNRCMVTAADLSSGVHDAAVPLKIMQPYRRVDKGDKYSPCFGVFAHPRGAVGNTLRVGDRVEVLRALEEGEERAPLVSPKWWLGE